MEKPVKSTPYIFDVCKSILNKNNYQEDFVEPVSQYLLSRFLASNTTMTETCLVAYTLLGITERHMYDLLFYSNKRNQYCAKWSTFSFKEEVDEDIELIRNYYSVSSREAQEIIRFMDKDKLDEIRKSVG